MKQLLIFFVLLIIALIPISNLAQRSNLPDKKQEITRTARSPIKISSDKSDIVNTDKTNPNIKVRNPQSRSPKPEETIIKNRTQRPPKTKLPNKKKKEIINEYVEIVEPLYIIQETVIYIDDVQKENYCEESLEDSNGIEIAKYSYPDFPLRFRKADIIYQFTHDDNDYYKISIEIDAAYENYFNTFGVLLKYFGGYEEVIVFNEDQEILMLGENYNFSKQINIEETGYINLRLGYYDDENKIFYPEELFPNRTDKLIFIESTDKVYLNKILF